MKGFAALPILTTVVAEESFTAAAKALGLTTSAVSKRITALETHLGVKLLHRTTRRVRLTEAGEHYYLHALEAVSAAETAETAAMSLQREPRGVLKIAAPWSFGRLYLAKIVPEFLKRNPQIDLDLSFTDELSNPSTDGYELVLYPGDAPTSTSTAKKLVRLYSVLCASSAYLEKNGRPKVPADLLAHNCIHSTHSSSRPRLSLIQNGEVTTIKAEGNYRVNSSEGLLDAVIHGVGIGRLPYYVAADALKNKQVELVLPTYSMPYKDLYTLCPNRRFTPPKVKVFADFLSHRLKKDIAEWKPAGNQME